MLYVRNFFLNSRDALFNYELFLGKKLGSKEVEK
jgi:hypothetical protein